MKKDLKTRERSVPFTPDVLGYIYNILGQFFESEIYSLPNGLSLTELYLTARIVAPDDQALSFRFAIGKLSESYVIDTDLTEAEIEASHKIITGTTDKITLAAGDSILIDGLNLIPAIKDLRKSDAFVFFIAFDTEPDFSLSGSIEKWFNGSALLGVL